MQVTDIKAQQKRTDRLSIFIDGRYSFSLSEAALLSSGLLIGLELDKDALSLYKDTAAKDKAYSRVLDLLSRRARSEWEVRDYLKRKETDASIIDETVARLQDRKLLDDKDFAERWVASRRLLKSTSRRRLELELRQKRVADDVVQAVLGADETDELDVIRELVQKKQRQARYQDTQKLTAFLLRQGFNYQDIKDALSSTD